MTRQHRNKAIITYLLVSLFLIFEMAVQVSPSIMTHQLMNTLNIGALGLGMISGAYFYTYTAMQIPAGLLFDRFNPRYMIATPIFLCAIGALLFGLSHHIYISVLARLFTGFGSAFAFISVLVVIADLFPKKHFALLTGVTQMLAAFGAMGGEWPLSKLVMHIGWRNAMYLLAAMGVVLGLVVWRFVRYEKPASNTNTLDVCSMRSSLRTILRKPQTWWIALYACMLWAPMSGFASLWGVPYLEKAYHYSTSDAAFIVAFMWLGIAFASPLLGWWSDAIGSRRIPLIVSAFIGIVGFALVLLYPQAHFYVLIAAVFASGAACAGQALSFAVVRDINADQDKAAAIGFNNMAVVISGAIFQPLIGEVIQSYSGALTSSSHAYRLGLGIILIAYMLACMIAVIFIKR